MDCISNNVKMKIKLIKYFILHNKMNRKIKSFFVNLKRSVKWFVRMWNNPDCDSTFLIEMMVHKLKDIRYQLDVVDVEFVNLRKQPVDFNYLSGTDCETVDELKELDEVIEIGEQLLKAEYMVYPEEYLKWQDEAIDDPNSLLNGEVPPEIQKLFTAACEKCEQEREKDNRMFFNLKRDNHHKCWS